MKRKYTKIVIFLGLSIIIGSFFYLNRKDSAGLRRNESFVVEITTTKGEIDIQLLNKTPLHRNNFVALAKRGYFDGILFHRIIDEFVIQAGDSTTLDRSPEAEKLYGEFSSGEDIPAEIFDDIHHFRGAVGMARDDNPEKKSSGSQFYIVQSPPTYRTQTYVAENVKSGKISEELANEYIRRGGTPFLDGGYTVFGYTIKGMHIVDQLAKIDTNSRDFPKNPDEAKILSTKVKIYTNKEIEKLYKNGK